MRRAEELQSELLCMCADRGEEIKLRNDMQVEWLRLALLDQGSKLIFAAPRGVVHNPKPKAART